MKWDCIDRVSIGFRMGDFVFDACLEGAEILFPAGVEHDIDYFLVLDRLQKTTGRPRVI